jgi:hypothetical protein
VAASKKTKTNRLITLELGEIGRTVTSGFIKIAENKSKPHNAKDAMSGV